MGWAGVIIYFMFGGPAAFRSSRVATTDDFICVPNGTPPGVVSATNTMMGSQVVGASLLSSIAPPALIPPVVIPPIAHPRPLVVSAGLPLGSTINAPIIPALPPLPAVSTVAPIIPVSTYQTAVIPPTYIQSYGVIPNSSRLLIEAPSITPIGTVGTIGRGSIVGQSPSIIVPTGCPQCACCYGAPNCCSFSTPNCGCGPAGCYPNCCMGCSYPCGPTCGYPCGPTCCSPVGPSCFDQCCFGTCPCSANCLGCRCFC